MKEKLNKNKQNNFDLPSCSLIQVSIQREGVYFMYKLPVKRGIKGKNKKIVDEVLVVGVPLSKVDDFCFKHGLIISNKRIYLGDFDNPILIRKDESFVYIEV